MIWVQVRDARAGHIRLAAAAGPVIRAPAAEPGGLTGMRIQDPGGIRILVAGVPAGHPVRRARDRCHRQGGEPCARGAGTDVLAGACPRPAGLVGAGVPRLRMRPPSAGAR